MHRARTLLAFTMLIAVAACTKNPITGKDQFLLLPEQQLSAQGQQACQQILSEQGESGNSSLTARVRQVGSRVVAASHDPGRAWEFHVINDETPNAFALPGGCVGVHTGLFNVVENDAQLAAVLGHELAHVTVQHHNERLSRQVAVETGLAVAGSMVSPETTQIMAQAATLGLVLPFSRSQEAEADEVGLMYMARAGYDPRAAIDVWQNFAAVGGGTVDFLSTHPSPGNRIERLQQLMPQAIQVYEASR
jgi:predicted Zn-dependent protease